MIFQSEKKKELLRYATRNNLTTCDGLPTQPPQQQRPQHPRRPQLLSFDGRDMDESATRRVFTPPPPYSSMPCSMDGSGSYYQHHHPYHQQQLVGRTDMSASASATEESECVCAPRIDCTRSGCSCVSSGDDMLLDENDQCRLPGPTSCSSCHPPRSAPAATTLAITAAKIFRNCCGGGGGHATDSSSGSTPASRRHSHSRPHHHQRTTNPNFNTCPTRTPVLNTSWPKAEAATAPTTSSNPKYIQDCSALMKLLKRKQLIRMADAVKSRVDAPEATGPAAPSHWQCILIKCTSAADTEQHVNACRLFFWADLRNASELKRLPICPSAGDYIYACCNPLHWYRIIHPIDAETAPPPYQRSKMLRLKDADSEENSQNIEKSAAAWSAQSNNSNSHSHSHSLSISSFIKPPASKLYGPSLESFTTDGEDHNVKTGETRVWCKIAYWELGQRVGELFQAKEPTVNVYNEGAIACIGDSMCLRDLVARNPQQVNGVQNTRQKIGQGVTLNLERDDVWIYNRGNIPIFVDSPTLSERLDRVCKVMPGNCLKAFDTHRAQILACEHMHARSAGPFDWFSMKISFAKGWGHTYRRQNITGCPCWLEVNFSR